MFFRELTVLGIVAFCLYTLESSGALQLDINDKHTFEKVHNSLFHVALLYGCLVGAVYYASVRLSRSWATLEDRVERADWKQLKRRWQELSDEVGMDDNSDPPSWVAWSRSKVRAPAPLCGRLCVSVPVTNACHTTTADRERVVRPPAAGHVPRPSLLHDEEVPGRAGDVPAVDLP